VLVFVSSTWDDLQPERLAVEDTLHRLRGFQFRGMEYFGSRSETPRDASLAIVDESDAYVGIIGFRYGSGITEAEYRHARERSLPCFIYLKHEPGEVPPEARDADPMAADRLATLKRQLMQDHIVTYFISPDDLARRVAGGNRPAD